MPKKSDDQLVADLKRGDQAAFTELVNRHQAKVYQLALKLTRNETDAEDVLQETFLRVYQRMDQFDPSRRFGPWLFRIGVNLTLDHLRKQKRRGWWSLFSESSADRPPDPPVADPRKQIELKQEVREVLDRIPEKYRTVLVLRDLESFTTSEIAAILDRKEATVRWRLAEARSRFQKLWVKRQAQENVAVRKETRNP